MKLRILTLPLLLVLAACSGNDMRSAIGLEYEEPDEFVVLSRPPLSVPPEFNLRPPRAGERGPAHATPEDVARAALLGKTPEPAKSLDDAPAEPTVDTAVTPVLESEAKSNAESLLLNRTGAEKADPDIREKLGVDASRQNKDAKSLLEKLNPRSKEDPVVDPTKETERVRKAKQQGKKINSDAVPVIDPSKKSIIDKIF